MGCCQCAGTCNHVGPHSYCAAHGGTSVPTFITANTNGWPLPVIPRLSEDDVERIAAAVIEFLEDRKSLKKSMRHPKRALRRSVPLEEAFS